MQIVFSDFDNHLKFAPLTLTRPVAELRFGILKLWEKWMKVLPGEDKGIFFETENYLQRKYPSPKQGKALIINPLYCPDKSLAEKVSKLQTGQLLIHKDGGTIALVLEDYHNKSDLSKLDKILYETPVLNLREKWHLFQKNEAAIAADYKILTRGKTSKDLPYGVQYKGENIFIESGAQLEHVSLNTDGGYIYIGKNVQVMDGSMIRGSVSLGENAVIKMGAKIYGASSFGPYCKVAGEVSNSIFQGFSNKAHDGFVGNSLLGEWCNLGADTNTSNLKNNYGSLRIFSNETNRMEQTDVQFCGVIMGDHSKTGINTMLNTGTVCGVNANIFGGDFPSKYLHSFFWGGSNVREKYQIDKAIEVAKIVYGRRNVDFTKEDELIMKHIFDHSD